MNILIAEDSEDARLILKMTLTSAGHDVCDAPNGAEALKMARKFPPDIIISDILMPEIDGFAFCREIKQDKQLHRIPFIFYTATYTDPKDERLAMSLGASRFILKPLESDKFLRIIDEVISEYNEHTLQVPEKPLKDEETIKAMHEDSLSRKLAKKIKQLEQEHNALLKKEAMLRESEVRYRNLIETANDAIFVADAETGIIVDANRKAEKLIGKPVEKIIGMHQADLHPEGESERYRKIFEQHVRTGHAISEELFVLNSTGERIPVEISASISEIGGKNIIQGIFRDIRERKQSHKELRDAVFYLDNVKDTLIIINPQTEIVKVNNEFTTLWGYTAEEVLGQPVALLFPEDEMPKHISEMEKAVSTKAPRNFETFALTKSGERIPLSVRGSCIFNNDGSSEGFISIFRDISEHFNTEEEKNRLLHAIETAKEAIIIINADLHIIFANKAMHRLFGYDDQKLLGKNIMILNHPDHAQQKAAEILDALHESGTWEGEIHNIRKDGSDFTSYASIAAIKDNNGNIINIITTQHDVTEHKKLELQLLQAQKMEAVGQLAGGIAHDFNNILSAIINYIYLIQFRTKDDALKNDLNQVMSLAYKASDITRGLLAFSRKQFLNPVALHLNNSVMNMEKLLSKFIGEDIEINIRLTEKEPVIMADRAQIEQIIMNLATNARDSMPDGGTLAIETDMVKLDRDFVTIHGFGEPGIYALLMISDTGRGMDEETRQKIFEPFFSTKETGKGTGLGLSIVYGIVKQHNSFITVYSEPDKGTTFRIYFRTVEAELKGERSVDLSDLRGNQETVLLAEDSSDVRESVQHILKEYGYKVIAAVDGQDAVEKYIRHKDDIRLLILDVIMPKKNGKETLDDIRKKNPDIKAIFTSGYAAELLDKKGIIQGEIRLVEKPILPEKLLTEIKEVLDSG